jgi:glycosyltransferase involved in cell wall biosynthesis
LYYTLQTCLSQKNFDNYEIIVSDNFSSPETKIVVERLNSPKIKYIRSDCPLSMTENWELGLSYASGEYITVVGDDDGLLTYCLATIDDLIHKTNSKVIKYTKVSYVWPNATMDNDDKLWIPLSNHNFCIKPSQVESLLQKVGNIKISYSILPCIYTSFIHEDLITTLKHQTGRVFNSPIPDVYSGFAFAFLNGGYYSFAPPLGIAGRSAKSNSASNIRFLNTKKENDPLNAMKEFADLAITSPIKVHPFIPDYKKLIFIHAPCIAEPFQKVKESLLADNKTIYLDRKNLTRICIRDIVRFSTNQEEIQENLRVLSQSLSDDNKLTKWFSASLEVRFYIWFYNKIFKITKIGSDNQKHIGKNKNLNILCDGLNVYIDTSKFGITNIVEASELAEKLLPHPEKSSFQLDDSNVFSLKNRINNSIKFLISRNTSLPKRINTIFMILFYGYKWH